MYDCSSIFHGAFFADFATPCSLNVGFSKLVDSRFFVAIRDAFNQLLQPAERIFPALDRLLLTAP